MNQSLPISVQELLDFLLEVPEQFRDSLVYFEGNLVSQKVSFDIEHGEIDLFVVNNPESL